MNKTKQTIVIILFLIGLSITFQGCEKDNYTPETYFPSKGDKSSKVEKYWGKPDDMTVSSISGKGYMTYYYENKRVVVWFIGDYVDSWSTY